MPRTSSLRAYPGHVSRTQTATYSAHLQAMGLYEELCLGYVRSFLHLCYSCPYRFDVLLEAGFHMSPRGLWLWPSNAIHAELRVVLISTTTSYSIYHVPSTVPTTEPQASDRAI